MRKFAAYQAFFPIALNPAEIVPVGNPAKKKSGFKNILLYAGIIALIGFLLPLQLMAQVTITGRILNQADTKPVENASVFLSNATIGDKTKPNGTFALKNVTPGKYNLVISIVGFDTFDQTVTVGAANINLNDILIYPKTIGLKEVTIKPDENRARNYQWFKQQFLGTSLLATDCNVLNPDVLNLDYDETSSTLTASSNDFLIIENADLGYRIKYLVKDFSFVNKQGPEGKILYKGAVLFEEMKGSERQQRTWRSARQKVYENSETHFLRAGISGRLDDDGFRVLKCNEYPNPERPSDSLINAKIAYCKRWKNSTDKRGDSLVYWEKKLKLPKMVHNFNRPPLNNSEFIFKTNQTGLFALKGDFDTLLVSYNIGHHYVTNPRLSYVNSPKNDENTLVCFSSPKVYFYNNGVVANPYDVILYGVWGRERVAELLPTDYDPNQGADAPQIQVDSTALKQITAHLETYAEKHIREKAYLHFDKPYYAASDTIYFKAYVTQGDSNKLSTISNVLHVDLVNGANKVSQSLLLPVLDGIAWGDFALPDSLPKGNYRVRAYTHWMLNDGNDAYPQADIPIGTVKIAKVPEANATTKAGAGRPDIQFFPEGGSLVQGVSSKIAFKAIGSDGLGISVKGEITDNDNNQVCTMESTRLGMGVFTMAPQPGKTYKATVIYPGGLSDVVKLAPAIPSGITMAVNNSFLKKISVAFIADSGFYLTNKNRDFTLLVYSAGVASPYIFKLDNTMISLDILKQSLHTGIAWLTLFSPTGEPLNERLAFIQNNDELNIKVSGDKQTYTKREKISLKLNTTDNTGAPAQGHFSVSVTNENVVPYDEASQHTILTDLLLTSDLKGYVEQPNYYFTKGTPRTDADLDLVMLTNGYRRFEWAQILNPRNQTLAFTPEKSLEVSGTVTAANGKLLDEGTISMMSLTGGPVPVEQIDKNGAFRFSNLLFPDSSYFVLKATNPKLKNRTVPVYNAEKPIAVTVNQNPLLGTDQLDKMMAAYLENRQAQLDLIAKYGPINGILLKEVKINQTKRDDDYPSSNLVGPGHADQVVHAKDLVEANGVFSDYFNGRLLGVTFVGNAGGRIAYLTAPITLRGNPPMLLVVDGVKFVGRDSISPDEISLHDIETVEVLRHSEGGIYGAFGGTGVLIITTKRGSNSVANESSAPGILTINPKGFYKARRFYSPNYSHPAKDFDREDLGSTIYWAPEVVTDKDGNAVIQYYNADSTGNYRVVVEGLDENGNLGRHVFHYRVE